MAMNEEVNPSVDSVVLINSLDQLYVGPIYYVYHKMCCNLPNFAYT